ncbi:hypothetical protein [Pseudomonas sp. P8_241]|uniref:response regulator n=1 Tax=Pseudomonas sp. P8_241 TaxID=3043445 RepID=UPI002A370B0D|nr:hypothetical protein [Pseudomonas sp. P8_241]WPN49381.1 hypothetical protein QMK58_12260 [Pseudomonas sp. P8_241]
MDGFELLRHLSSHPRAKRIPVIFITAKPINPELLQLKVSNQLRQIEQRKQLKTDYDNLLNLADLREDIEQQVELLASRQPTEQRRSRSVNRYTRMFYGIA